jgi:hypothetical protein
MRLLFGIILGACLTVGGAYIYDSTMTPDASAPSAEQRPMVNWDVVARNFHGLTARVHQQWNKLTSG